MSVSSAKTFKKFSINNIQDACVVLASLIQGMIVNLEKYKVYAEEAEQLLLKTNSNTIPAKAYEDIKDKLLFRQHELLKLCADHQNDSLSYKSFRKTLEKKGYLKTPLSDETTRLLSDLLDIRNWTFHNPVSLLVADREVALKKMPESFKNTIEIAPQLNPVFVTRVDAYELDMLVSMTLHTQTRINQFQTILNCMKSDYQELFDSLENKPLLVTPNGFCSDVQYVDYSVIAHIDDHSSDVAQISMAIQKSKYNGSDDSFNKYVLRRNKS